MGDKFSALSKPEEKEAFVSNAGGECAVSGCKQYATATNAVTGLKYAKWYCTPHAIALRNGADYKQINAVTQKVSRTLQPGNKHWADRLMDGESKGRLIAGDKEKVNLIHENAKL